MSNRINISATFNSHDPIGLIHSICSVLQPFNQKLPTMLTDGYEEYTDTKYWIDKLLPTYERGATAYWGYGYIGEYEEGFIIYKPQTKLVTFKINDFELVDVKSLIKMLSSLPWTVANFHQITRQGGWKKYRAPGFADGHGGHGWACAFKGEGHKHLVSRRWLKYHPWHLIRDEENDISFVQFHDLDAEPSTALLQAKPGHRAMSIYGVGGYIGKTHPFSNDLKGLYVPEHRNLRVVIPAGKEITYSEMSDYCAARHFQAFEEGEINVLSFVFIVAAEAQPYLHDLWLREIECSGFTEQGVEVRLDTDYHPVYEHPEWVKQLRQKQQQQEQQERLESIMTRLSQIKTEMKRLDDRIKNLSGGSYDRALHTRIKELKAQSSKLIGEKNKLEREKANLEQEIDQANL